MIPPAKKLSLAWPLALIGLGGCVHVRQAALFAERRLPPPGPVSADTGLSLWWLLLLLIPAVFFLLRRMIKASSLDAFQPADREDLALLRTARDALSLLFKRQLKRFKVIPLELLKNR